MGATDSKQNLGERVRAARKKLDEDMKMQRERSDEIRSKSPATMKVIIESIEGSFKSCSPFLEPSLLIAWKSNPDKCKDIILRACRKVLSAPIIKSEYDWFKQYVFPTSIWMFKTKQNRFMYEELIDIANNMSSGIINSMDSIYDHLKYHPKWKQLMEIKTQTFVSRQDDKKVGLLQEKGVGDILESKEEDNSSDLQSFIDSNLAINILTTTAKNINNEFQNHIKTVMSRHGDFKPGPLKKVERCVSKVENDYQDAIYPKSSKLLDIVRCSVTFNTVDQLINGFHQFTSHIEKNKSIIELARVKNGFLDGQSTGGYRDIKLNVIYRSQINMGVNMVCEVQLLLGQYLHEKKRIHKLYSIIRQELYFKMAVTVETENVNKNPADLKFVPVLELDHVDGSASLGSAIGKCSIDTDLNLLAVEAPTQISCIDINSKKMIFTKTRNDLPNATFSHNFILKDNTKYMSFQTKDNEVKFFEIKNGNNFKEAKKFTLSAKRKDVIYGFEFDKNCENVIVVKNGDTLEKRAVKNINKVLVSIKLKQSVNASNGTKILSLSNDGALCILGGGYETDYCYLIDIDKKIQTKLVSNKLDGTYSPCFINGQRDYCAVGGEDGLLEIWDLNAKKSIKIIEMGKQAGVTGMNSSNNILAVGSGDKKLRLFDVRTWETFYSDQYEMYPTSIDLTADSQYVTVGGWNGERCVLLGMQY